MAIGHKDLCFDCRTWFRLASVTAPTLTSRLLLRSQQGDTITFSWQFVGIGEERCYHDDVELPECKSPMRVCPRDRYIAQAGYLALQPARATGPCMLGGDAAEFGSSFNLDVS